MVAARLRVGVGTEPATPPTGYADLFVLDSDKKLRLKNDAGLVTLYALNGVVGPANAVYLTTTGDDGTGQRGDPTLPFASLKAALAECQNGDILMIGPGTFTIDDAAEVPVWPVGVNRLTIQGSGSFEPLLASTGGTGTRITSGGGTSANAHIFDIVDSATGVTFRDLSLQVTAGTGSCIRAVGAGASFMTAGLLIDNVNAKAAAGPDVQIFYANLVWINRLVCLQSFGTIFNTSNILLMSDSSTGNIGFTWNAGAGANLPSIGRVTSSFRSCAMEDLTLTGEPDLSFLSCTAENIESNAVLTTTDDPGIEWNGGKVRDIDFLTDPWSATGVDCRVTFVNISCDSIEVGCDGGGIMDLKCRGVTCAGNIIIDDGVTASFRGGSYRPTSTTTPGTGTFTPDYWPCQVTTDAATPATVAFGITAVGPASKVYITALGAGLGDFYPDTFTATGFNLNWSGAAVAGVPVAVLAFWEN